MQIMHQIQIYKMTHWLVDYFSILPYMETITGIIYNSPLRPCEDFASDNVSNERKERGKDVWGTQ